MHRVGSASNGNNSTRPRKEKRLTYVLNDSDDTKHCAGINCLALLTSVSSDGSDYLFTGSRDGRLKRWVLDVDRATCSATFESHVDWVNDAVLVGDSTLVSCSSDTNLKLWNALSFGTCTRTLRQHSDYVTCLAAAGKNSNIVASGGLGGEVFIWDIESAIAPVSKSNDATGDESSNGINGSGNLLPLTSLRTINSNDNMSMHTTQTQGYIPISAKGHKDSVYALAMNESGTILVSGGTEKVVRVWDTRSGSKTLKLRGHTDNIRALLLDSSGRYCLSGSSDSMIRLWDIGQQRCVHSYAVHTDSVWALASTPTFSHVYSGGRDFSLYLTDLQTRESSLLCTGEHPILQLALHDDNIWVASTDSSVRRWHAEGCNPEKIFQRGNSFLAGNLSFSRARVSLEGSTPVPVYKEPTLTILGTPAIVQHEVLNNKRHVLTKDASGSVKLWEITKGVVIEDYGKVSFEDKKEELFEMVSIPAWFTVDTRLGSLSVHLDTPQCFHAEMYSADLNIVGKPEDDKVNLARETLKGLLASWLRKRKQRSGSSAPANGELLSGKDTASRSSTHSRIEVDGSSDNDAMVYPPFEFSVTSPPSIITEGTHGGPWRKKTTDLDGTKDDKDFPWWCLDCVLNNRLPPRENTKCSFYLQPCEGSSVQILTQGKLSAPITMPASLTSYRSIFLILWIVILCGHAHARFFSRDLLSDGVSTNSWEGLLRLPSAITVESSCEQTYGFLPCTTTVLGNLFLILIYGFLMFKAATFLSGGSELLLEILGPGIVGGLFLPILGALPDAMLILVSGLSGSKETAQSQVSVGMGLLAGSTVLLLTIIWGTCVIVGKCDIEDSIAIDSQDTRGFSLTGSGVSTDIWTSYSARIMVISVLPFVIVQLPQILNSTSGRHLAVLIALIVSLGLLVAYCLYQIFQPWIQRRKLEYIKHKHVILGFLTHLKKRALGRLLNDNGEPDKEVIRKLFTTIDESQDGSLTHNELRALVIGIQFEEIDLDHDDAVTRIMNDFDTSGNALVDEEEFVNGVCRWLQRAQRARVASGDAGPHTMKFLSDFHTETKREHDLLDVGDQSNEEVEGIENSKWISIKAVLFLLLGSIIAAAFADPLVDAVDNFSEATSIPAFFISFIFLPLATNSSEAVSAIIFASRDKRQTASLTFSEIYGAVTMNNVLCLSVFLALVYARGLTWDFSSEVLVILVVCILLGVFASFRTVFPLWTSILAILLYPFSLALVYVLDYVFGWS